MKLTLQKKLKKGGSALFYNIHAGNSKVFGNKEFNDIFWIGFEDPESSYFLEAKLEITEQQMRDFISNRVWSNMKLYTQE